VADATGEDEALMQEAMAAAAAVRGKTSPNPWVGCVIVPQSEAPAAIGATEPPGGRHAEAVALALAGDTAKGSSVYVTLEPCCHYGRTPPCADALIEAGVRRVVIGLEDPDPHVSGAGLARLKDAGVDVEVGVGRDAIAEQLAPYLKHRATGRPWVILKLAATLDGRTAAPDGSSRWITGRSARADAHRLRAESDAVLVGAGTVRSDDPALTVRHVEGFEGYQPLRVVLGAAPARARVQPALALSGDLDGVLKELGARDVVQLLVEGGAKVAHEFHHAGLVDRYVLYVAPAFFAGDDAKPLFAGPGAADIQGLWRGRIVSLEQLGPDLRVELAPADRQGD
jgi:diaminohydroxyphosphoribosylaminopyrimidine deaminase/5-amino-6-(5-phosphoribosylamino)uracil reductase